MEYRFYIGANCYYGTVDLKSPTGLRPYQQHSRLPFPSTQSHFSWLAWLLSPRFPFVVCTKEGIENFNRCFQPGLQTLLLTAAFAHGEIKIYPKSCVSFAIFKRAFACLFQISVDRRFLNGETMYFTIDNRIALLSTFGLGNLLEVSLAICYESSDFFGLNTYVIFHVILRPMMMLGVAINNAVNNTEDF